jgi:membrane-anchored mycosin MYCP
MRRHVAAAAVVVMRRHAAAVTVAVLAVLVVPAPARGAHVCDRQLPRVAVSKGTPVEDRVYDVPGLAALATGAGVRVAVLDSGVDDEHPQLRGRVERGRDFLHNDPTGRQDCRGHGTGVASVIAARPVAGTGFQGLAPETVIVPVRISEREVIDDEPSGDQVEPRDFARAIRFAVDTAEVQVINLSVVMTADDAQVAAAVRHAVESGVVVVAAVGNEFTRGNPRTYPAAYPGVIGVASVNADGVRSGFSGTGDFVDIAAIGEKVTVAAPGSGHQPREGTSFATPFVSATAALLKERFPDAGPEEIARRLLATADPAPGSTGGSPQYGHGLLNPHRALTETLGPATRAPAAPVLVRAEDPAQVAAAARRARSHDRAMLFAGAGAGAVLLAGLAAMVVRRGRGRGWRPAPPEANR